MSIGSVYGFDYKLTDSMRTLLEKWENSLETNHDEFNVVDNEEGDYGIIRYFDANGVEMLTKVVQAGDTENTYFTGEGADAVRQLLRKNFNDMLELALIAGMPTPDDLKAHIPPKVNVIDLKNHVLPDTLGSYDLIIFDGNRYLPFRDPDNSTRYLFWCPEEDEYLRADRKLYATVEEWREYLLQGFVCAGVHKKGLFDLIRFYKANEAAAGTQ